MVVQMQAATMTSLKDGRKYSDAVRPVLDTSPAKISDLLMGLPLFHDIESWELQVLSRHFRLYSVDAGGALFNEGDKGDFMALIVEGAADLTKQNDPKGPVKVATEGVGRTLGEMALIDGEPRSATARFAKSGKVLLLTRESFEGIMNEQPRLGIDLLWRICRVLSQRLRRTTGSLSERLN
jgi:CRP-like cAMP-binding protein